MPNQMVDNILQALRDNEAIRSHKVAEALAEKQAQSLDEERKNRIELERERHKQQTEHEKATLAAAEKVYQLHRLAEFQKIGQNAQEGQPVPTGLDVVQNSSPGMNTILDPSNPQQTQVPGVIGEVPLPARMEVQQPLAYAQDVAQRQEVTEAPKRNTQASLQAAEALRQLAVAKQAQDALDARAAADRDARKQVADAANATRVKTALITASRAANANSENARNDRSFNTNVQQLTKVEQPISDALTRFDKLEDTINFASPATDPLIAPELLTVMAGGAQSGLRMNEAEIARIVGGRTAYEGLKSTFSKLSADPNKPFLLTPVQRQQTLALVREVGSKLSKKQAILTQARKDLIDAKDPDTHRRVLSSALEAVKSLDTPDVLMVAPDGVTMRYVHPEDVEKAKAAGAKVK